MTGAAALLITYLGTASFIVQYGDTRILTDPGDFFTGRLTVEIAESLPAPGLILVTHTDFDHINRLKHVPGSATVPILAPESVKRSHRGYRVVSEKHFTLGGVTASAFPSVHGFFHGKDHRSYLVEIGGMRLCFLGDAFRIDPAGLEAIRGCDILFVTIGGIETNIDNALKNVALIEPKTVIPMHWETIFRSDAVATKFLAAMNERFPLVECVIPEYGIPSTTAGSF